MTKTALLIIRPGAIGDTLLTFPILQHVRQQDPDCSITFVGNPTVLPLLHSFGLADHVSSYEDPQWGELFLATTTPKKRLQVLLQETNSAIAWMSDSTGIVEANLRSMGITNYIQAAGRPPNTQAQHIVLYLAKTIGLHWENDADITWQPPAAYRWQATQSNGITTRRVVIHPGSGGKQKCWPVASFAAVINALWQQQIPVTLLEGPADTERLHTLIKMLPTPANPALLRRLSNAPLLTIVHELQECQNYIGNDSGITHLAALLHVPSIALFGPSDPAIWHPVGPTVQIMYQASDITKITPESILRYIHNGTQHQESPDSR